MADTVELELRSSTLAAKMSQHAVKAVIVREPAALDWSAATMQTVARLRDRPSVLVTVDTTYTAAAGETAAYLTLLFDTTDMDTGLWLWGVFADGEIVFPGTLLVSDAVELT